MVQALQTHMAEGAAPLDFLVEEDWLLADLMADGQLQPNATTIAAAVAHHQRRFDLTLLLGLDLPPRDAAPAGTAAMAQQASLDAGLRQALQAQQLHYTVVYGLGRARTDCAWQAIAHHINSFDAAQRGQARGARSAWQWCCDNCSDAVCEHRLFRDLMAQEPSVRT